MSSLEVWLIIILVLGVIASNLAVLKYSSKFKMTQFGKPQHKPQGKKQGDSHKSSGIDNGSNKPEASQPQERSSDSIHSDKNRH